MDIIAPAPQAPPLKPPLKPPAEPDTKLFDASRRTGIGIRVVCKSGRCFVGTVHTFGRFTVAVKTVDGVIVIYKNAIEFAHESRER